MDRDGLGRLSVAALAREARVTRPLVYHHFGDINDLVRAVVEMRFAGLLHAIDELAATSGEVSTLVAMSAQLLFSVDVRDRRLLRYIYGGLANERPELAPVVGALRAVVIERWLGYLEVADSRDARSRAEIWGLLNAVFGLGDLIDAGELIPGDALEIVHDLVEAVRRSHRRRET